MLQGFKGAVVRMLVALAPLGAGSGATAATLTFNDQGIASLSAFHASGTFTDDYTFQLAGPSRLGATISNLVIASGMTPSLFSAITSFAASIYAVTDSLSFDTPLSTLSFNAVNGTLSRQDINLGFGTYTLRVTGDVSGASAFYVGALATTTPVPLPAPFWLVAGSLFAFTRWFRHCGERAR